MTARIVALTFLVACTACGGGDAPPRVADLQSELVSAPTPAYSGACPFPATQALIKTEAEWQRVWAELFACMSPQPDLPPVDFAREMLAIVALGARSSGGYSVAIQRAGVGNDGVLRIQAVEYVPRRCTVATVITYPVAVARVPRTDAESTFGTGVNAFECD